MKIKIISWNIWVDCNFEQVAKFLKASSADIIGLQEVRTDDKNRDVISFLSSLGYDYVYALVQKWKQPKFNFGPAIFSKYPIKEEQTYMLSKTDERVAVEADIDINGKVLHIFNTHLIHTHQQPSDIQDEQGDNLIKLLPSEQTIVMGDFNATPESEVIKKMRGVMKDTCMTSAPTLNASLFDCPGCDQKTISDTRLDYIFTTKDISVESFKVEKSKASDHLPVLTVIDI